MKKSFTLASVLLFIFAFFSLVPALFAKDAQTGDASSGLVQVTITATSRSGAAPPALEAVDVLVHQDKQRRTVVSLLPANSSRASLDFAILIDDNLNTSLGTQFDDLKEFIRSLPENSRIAIAYAANGVANMQLNFTTDRAAAEKALRLPTGRLQTANGVYFALSDLVNKWPQGAARREVLLITDGIDLTYGVDEISPGINPALDQAIETAQRNNVTVYSLFASGTGFFARNQYLILNGQGSLSRLTLDTGGDSFSLGFQTPVAFHPFLQQLTQLLGQQYLLTFRADLPQTAGFHALNVSTEMSGVQLIAPSRVFLPARP